MGFAGKNIRLDVANVHLGQLGQSEIQYLSSPVFRNKDVLGFEIAMYDSMLVSCRQA